jgi:DNA uptake protein ComE-like DNA-binding protein
VEQRRPDDRELSQGGRVRELEEELEQVQQAWREQAERRARLSDQRSLLRRAPSRKAQKAATAREAALAEYARVWRELEEARRASAATGVAEPGRRKVSLSHGELGELRAAGLTMTQALRIIRHRRKHGPFESIDALDRLPGLPDAHLARIKPHVVP